MSAFSHTLRDGRSVHVEDHGSGLPVFFQHGLGGDRNQVADSFPAELACRRITMECRGHGLTGLVAGEPVSIAGFVDDLLTLADALGFEKFVVGGISMGAAIALRIAITHPERVAGLILVRPAWISTPAPPSMAPFCVAADHLRRLGNDGRAAFLASPTGQKLAAEAPDNLASLSGFFDRSEPQAFADVLDAIASDGPGVDYADICALSVPTLVVGHDLDLVHPLAYARTLGDAIPNAHLAEITPKAVDKARYSAELRAAIAAFIRHLDTSRENRP